MMKKQWISAILITFLLTPAAFGQSVTAAASTLHVFPQAVDGAMSGGSSYVSTLWIDNQGSSTATCQILGALGSRFDQQTFSIPYAISTIRGTLGQGALASGFVQLSCSQPVSATLTYILSSPRNDIVGMATVLPARAVTQTFLQHTPWASFGVAIANTSDTTLSLGVRFNGTNGQSVTGTISVPPSSRYVKFVDQILNLSTTTKNGVFIITSQSNTPFYMTELMFIGSSFTTLVPSGTNASTDQPSGGTPTGSNLCATLEGASIIASDGQFLGKISSNKFDSQSIANEFGTYGSKFSSTSIFNEFGTYGSPFSNKSAFNEFATSPPSIFINSKSVGFLTTNTFKTPRIDTWAVVACAKG
jgi:hypothetical protein